ncbi:MAG: hypothetical protein AB7O38_30385, partial [Pirellulaceae bacterium]
TNEGQEVTFHPADWMWTLRTSAQEAAGTRDLTQFDFTYQVQDAAGHELYHNTYDIFLLRPNGLRDGYDNASGHGFVNAPGAADHLQSLALRLAPPSEATTTPESPPVPVPPPSDPSGGDEPALVPSTVKSAGSSAGGGSLAGSSFTPADPTSPTWVDILNSLNGVTVQSAMGDAEIRQLLLGQLPGSSDVLEVTIAPEPDSYAPVRTEFGLVLDSFAALRDSSGSLAAELRPLISLGVGFDGDGFYLNNGSSVGGRIRGLASARGVFGPLDGTITGEVGLDASIALAASDADGDGRIRVAEFLSADILNSLQISLSDVEAILGVELTTALLDYVDADGNPHNNTVHGGDPFRFRASTSLAATVPDGDGGFKFTWNGIEILNGIGQDNFTSEVLVDNLRLLAQDAIRGQRTELGTELLHALGLDSIPFADPADASSSLATGLSIAQALGDVVLDNLQVLWVVPFADGVPPTPTTPEENDTLEDWLNHGLPPTPQELLRLSLDLGQIGLDVADTLKFDLSDILPDAPGSFARAGVENAQLAGELVFGLDTSTNPFYLLTAPDDITPEVSTTFGGQFDMYVNISGEPLSDGLLTLQNADVRMTPSISVSFAGDAEGKFRLGDNLVEIAPVGVTLSGADILTVTADGAALGAGPLSLVAEDDDPTQLPQAVEGTIRVSDGSAQLQFQRVIGDLSGAVSLRGENVQIAFGPAVPPSTPLLTADSLILGLALRGLPEVEVSASDLEVFQDGTVTLRSASGTLDPATYAQALAGLLPFRLTQVDITPIDLDGDGSADPIRLDNFQADVTVTGYVDDVLLASLPFTPVIRIGDEPQSIGAANTFAVTYRLVDGAVLPWDIGPISLGIHDAVAGPLTLDGEIQLGGYHSGAWDPTLSGRFTVVGTGGGTEDDAFQGLEIEILPEYSSLTNPSNLFVSGGQLRVLGEARLSDSFSGSLDGISLAGATLGFEAVLTATPTGAVGMLDYGATFELLEIRVQEFAVDLE